MTKKFAYRNNWEDYEFYVDGVRVHALSIRSVLLKFPSGWEEWFYVHPNEVTNTVSDMGRTYKQKTQNPYIELDYEGIKMKQELRQIVDQIIDVWIAEEAS